ncbi:glucose-6-phosphate isomerase [Mycoplasmopsis mustelae]|uniref:Glucose-6-phosphate isomerase n=1 Tax=Mycoplasmopsis mustelae TaxID=171289 RepID=A0A4R7UC64_9BACT|nr:hypothetical protein [Mycoplasmopsis mustelae]TDV23278.1 glucose-6-phosphate isomerase [Mycoplasmopsis mustelae]
MSKIKFHASYKPKINTNIIEDFNYELLQKLKSLNFQGSENLGFDDIAINYSVKGFNDIIAQCDLLYKNNIEYLLVVSSKETELILKAAIKFIFGPNDFNADKKIKLIFINNEDTKINIQKKVHYYFQLSNISYMGVMFLDVFSDNNKEKNIWLVEHILSKFNQQASDFFIKRLIYYIGKKEWFSYLKKYNIPEKNILFVSSSVHNKYSFFSEICLVILATQGVNLTKLIHGYKSVSESLNSDEQYFNKALSLVLHLINFYELNTVDKTKLNLFVGYDSFLFELVSVFALHFNLITIKDKVFNDSCIFPENISSIGQPVLSNGLEKILFYFVFDRKYFDYRSSSNVDYDDLLSKFSSFTFDEFNKISLNAFDNYFVSYTDNSKSVRLEIQQNDEEALGELIGILYWAKILYCIYHDSNPFD